jgi:hypothetical protein
MAEVSRWVSVALPPMRFSKMNGSRGTINEKSISSGTISQGIDKFVFSHGSVTGKQSHRHAADNKRV